MKWIEYCLDKHGDDYEVLTFAATLAHSVTLLFV